MPHVRQIGKILSFICEAVHRRIPPDDLKIFAKHIIDNFITEGCHP